MAESDQDLERRVRLACRDRFREQRLLQRILPDIDALLETPAGETAEERRSDATGEFDLRLWNRLFEEV